MPNLGGVKNNMIVGVPEPVAEPKVIVANADVVAETGGVAEEVVAVVSKEPGST
jgi:hypothetical protein